MLPKVALPAMPPETLCSLASPSSMASDQLSCLGVRLKEFPDPLAGWEELEPGIDQRRNHLGHPDHSDHLVHIDQRRNHFSDKLLQVNTSWTQLNATCILASAAQQVLVLLTSSNKYLYPNGFLFTIEQYWPWKILINIRCSPNRRSICNMHPMKMIVAFTVGRC